MSASPHSSGPDQIRRVRRMTRRQFTGRAIALGLSVSTLGLFASACSSSAPAAPPPPPASSAGAGSQKPAESAAKPAAPPAPPASQAGGQPAAQQAAPAAKGQKTVTMWWEGKLPYEE